MRKIILYIFVLITSFGFAQSDSTKNNGKPVEEVLYSYKFISIAEADKILQKPTVLIDSSFKSTQSAMLYHFIYVAKYKDSTSKGRLFFGYEFYKNDEVSKNIYSSVKAENEKTGAVTIFNDMGDEAFMQKDNLGQPFIIIRKKNKIFKLRLYYLTEQTAVDELIRAARRIALKR